MQELEILQQYGPGVGYFILIAIGIYRSIPVLYRNRSPRALWAAIDVIISDYSARVDRFRVGTERRRSEVRLNEGEAALNYAILERSQPPPGENPCKCATGISNVRRSDKHRTIASHGPVDPDKPTD